MKSKNTVISLAVGQIEYSRIQMIKDVYHLSNSAVVRVLFDHELTITQLYDKACMLKYKIELTAADYVLNGVKII